MSIKNSKMHSKKGQRSHYYEAAKIVLINTIILGSILLATELGLQGLGYGQYFYSRTQPGQFEDRTFGARQWPRKDSELGWVLSDGTPDFHKPEGLEPSTYKANRQGFREKKDFAAIDYNSGKKRVMVLGDSFLFGVHLDAQDTITAILERKMPDYEIYNLGIPGWGIDQMYLAYKKYVDIIKPQIVMLLYIDDDLQRIYEAFREGEGMNKPSFSLHENRLVERTKPAPESFWKLYLIDKSIIANKLYVIYKNIEIKKLAKALFSEIITETQKRGERFIVLRLPMLEDLSKRVWPDMWSLKSFFAEKNCFYLELRNQMPPNNRFYIPNDGHFSAEGTAYVAEIISKIELFTKTKD